MQIWPCLLETEYQNIFAPFLVQAWCPFSSPSATSSTHKNTVKACKGNQDIMNMKVITTPMVQKKYQFQKRRHLNIMFKMCLNIPSSTQPLHNNQILQSFYPQLPGFAGEPPNISLHFRFVSLCQASKTDFRQVPEPSRSSARGVKGWLSWWLNQPI